MSDVLIMQTLNVYSIGDTPEPINVDPRFRNITIVVEPWSVGVAPVDLKEIVVDEANFVDGGAEGIVDIKLQTDHSFRKHELPNNEGSIDLAAPHFVNVGAPARKVYPSWGVTAGCTHISISITGVPY